MPFIPILEHRLEYAWFGELSARAPVVMLHEGLGSVALWREFPGRLAAVTGRRVLAYSRYGYGKSDPLREKREPTFMHTEALEVLPRLIEALDIERPVLFGHSDGGSISLIHAGAGRWSVTGVVVLAPHVFVEECCTAAIRQSKITYDTTDLRTRLARYHDDPDSAFRGWNDIWLDPRFTAWNIEEFLPSIACPVLAIQGEGDEYGTMEQIDRIERQCPHASLLKLEHCGHSPHRDQPDAVLRAAKEFMAGLPA